MKINGHNTTYNEKSLERSRSKSFLPNIFASEFEKKNGFCGLFSDFNDESHFRLFEEDKKQKLKFRKTKLHHFPFRSSFAHFFSSK
jgi:hypothetical protein